MDRQTLVRRDKVLGPGHPRTLASVHCIAYLLTHQHCYKKSRALCVRPSRYQAVILVRDQVSDCLNSQTELWQGEFWSFGGTKSLAPCSVRFGTVRFSEWFSGESYSGSRMCGKCVGMTNFAVEHWLVAPGKLIPRVHHHTASRVKRSLHRIGVSGEIRVPAIRIH
jgi:hypothetical protein